MDRRTLLRFAGAACGTMLAGCGSNTDPSGNGTNTRDGGAGEGTRIRTSRARTETPRSPVPSSTERTSEPAPSTVPTVSHPHLEQCPDVMVRALGDPLSIRDSPDENFDVSEDPTRSTIRRLCRVEHQGKIERSVNQRASPTSNIRQVVFDRERDGKTVVVAGLVFDLRVGEDGIPPIGFARFREIVPASFTATVNVNGRDHGCTVPIFADCWQLR